MTPDAAQPGRLICRSPELESPLSHGADFLAGDSILELSNLGPGPPGLPSLMRGISDVTTDSDVPPGSGLLPPSISDQDIPSASWQATSAGLWPVRADPAGLLTRACSFVQALG